MTIGSVDGTAAAMTPQQTAKLAAGAKEFESMMLGEMLKPLNFAGSENGDEASGASGTVGSMATDALAKGISANGGMGFARQIIRQVTAEHEQQYGGAAGTKV